MFTNSRDLKLLKKTEMISLIHLMNKLSESLGFYSEFLEIEKENQWRIKMYKHAFSYLGIVLIFTIFKLL